MFKRICAVGLVILVIAILAFNNYRLNKRVAELEENFANIISSSNLFIEQTNSNIDTQQRHLSALDDVIKDHANIINQNGALTEQALRIQQQRVNIDMYRAAVEASR